VSYEYSTTSVHDSNPFPDTGDGDPDNAMAAGSARKAMTRKRDCQVEHGGEVPGFQPMGDLKHD
jgi:hypothetical protein